MINKIITVELIDSVQVTNNPSILKWIVDKEIAEVYKTNGKKGLSQTLITELTNLFGKHSKTFRSEFNHKIWTLKYKDLMFNVFTAKRKGTSIEICFYTCEEIRKGKNQNEIIEFLELLYELINKQDIIVKSS